jgi:hypothetical protein
MAPAQTFTQSLCLLLKISCKIKKRCLIQSPVGKLFIPVIIVLMGAFLPPPRQRDSIAETFARFLLRAQNILFSFRARRPPKLPVFAPANDAGHKPLQELLPGLALRQSFRALSV